MSQLSVVLATPSLTEMVPVEFTRSLAQTFILLYANNVKVQWIVYGKDPYLAKVRNKLVDAFFRDYPDYDQFFFLDDDISWQPEKVLEFLQRPEDVVAGVYPKKQAVEGWPCAFEPAPDGVSIQFGPTGLMKMLMVPTGFLRIRRSVLEAQAVKYGTYLDDPESPGQYREFPNIFQMGKNPSDGRWTGEDVAWCGMCKDMGIDIWLDPNINFTHRGTHKWQGNVMVSLENGRIKAEEQAFAGAEPNMGKAQ